jgi:hypothetical protein
MKNKLVILAILFGTGVAAFSLLSIKLFSEASYNNSRALVIQGELNEQQKIINRSIPKNEAEAMRELNHSMDNGLIYLIANNNSLRLNILLLFALGLINGGISAFFIIRSVRQKGLITGK